jgi:hypothetical protein
MSMIGRLREVTGAEIDAYLAAPARFYRNFLKEPATGALEFPDAAPQALKEGAARLGALASQHEVLGKAKSAQTRLNRKLAGHELTPEEFLAASKAFQEEIGRDLERYLQESNAIIAQTRRTPGVEQEVAAYMKRVAETASEGGAAGGELTLEKSWHCLQYIIAGDAERTDGSADAQSSAASKSRTARTPWAMVGCVS